MVTVAIIAGVILVWSAFSRPLDRRGITSALVFTVAGFVAGAYVLGLIDVSLESAVAERFTEVTLVLLLFSDAARLDLGALRHELGWPSRLLLIGLPLTMIAGFGLAVPFFLVALDLANAELTTGITWAVVSNAAEQIGWGLLAGVIAGVLGGLLLRVAGRRGWTGSEWRQILPLAAALLAFAIALWLGGSVFIAAFVGGMAFGRFSGKQGSGSTLLTEETGGVLAAVTWIGFGAVGIAWAIPHLTWQVVLYAALSLTLVRMVPVAIALLGKGVQAPTVAFIGWFGPRGLASVVFGLLVVERGVPQGETLLTTVIVTVALSVLLHGLTSAPLVGVYHRWYEAHAGAHPKAAEAVATTMPRQRRHLAAGDPEQARTGDSPS